MTLDAPDLSVKHLRAVAALARFGSFIAAASFLGVSQPGLSRIIQQAEALLGVTLFLRGSRSVTLSEAGREFAPVAERLLIELAQQAQRMRALDGEMRGQLSIASLMSISHRVLPEALVAFRTQHPKMVIRVRDGFGDQVVHDVRGGLADLGVGAASDLPADIVVDRVVEDPFYVVLPAFHPLAGEASLTLAGLAAEALVSMPVESGLRRSIDLAASAQGVALDHSLITNQFASLFRFVASGLGATVAPATVLPSAADPGFAILPLEPTISRRIGVLRRADRPLSPTAEMFLDLFEPRFRMATQPIDADLASKS